MRAWKVPGGALLWLAAVGCGPAHNAKVRFANEFQCRDEVTVRALGGDAYDVRGCDTQAKYLCKGTTCLREYSEEPAYASQYVPPAARAPRRARGSDHVAATKRDDGTRVLRAKIGNNRFAMHLQATPGSDDGIVHLGLRIMSSTRGHEGCPLRLMADGRVLDMGETGYRYQQGYEELRSSISYDDLFVWGESSRVLGRVCDDEFRISEDRLNTVREFVMRLREEMTWQEQSETSGGEDEAEGREGAEGKDAPAPEKDAPEERGEVL